MTFDPSLRLKQTLGVGEEARHKEVRVALDAPGHPLRQPAGRPPHLRPADRALRPGRGVAPPHPGEPLLPAPLGHARRHPGVHGGRAPLRGGRPRGRYGQVILDTPPTRQALDFLEAPARIVGFLDSGALRVALKPWFDEDGRLRAASRWGPLGRRAERFLDEVVGMDLLRDMAEFFQAFAPLYEGFRERAPEVESCCARRRPSSSWSRAPGEERSRTPSSSPAGWSEAGYHLGPIVVNRVHPRFMVEGGQLPSSRSLQSHRLGAADLAGGAGPQGPRRAGEAPLPRAAAGRHPPDAGRAHRPRLAGGPGERVRLPALGVGAVREQDFVIGFCRTASKTP